MTVILSNMQKREYNRAESISNLFKAQKDVIKFSPAFSDEADAFTVKNDRLLELAPKKDVTGTGITGEKNVTKEATTSLANIICERTTAYARKVGDKVLEKSIYKCTSLIARLADGDVVSYVNSLVGTVTPLLGNVEFEKFGVTEEMLTTVTGLATAFNDSIGVAKTVDSKRNYISKQITAVLKDISVSVSQFDLLISLFADKDPEFVAAYRTAAKIDMSNIRHSGIEGIVTDSHTGLAIEGVVFTGVGKKKTTKSKDDGYYKLVKLKYGTMPITIEAPGYDTQVVIIKVQRGIIQKLNVAMQAKAIEMPAIQTA